MSVTITQHPSSISFVGNPVLLKVQSDLSGKTFQKVCAEITAECYRRGFPIGSFKGTVSIPTEGEGAEVVFDFSEFMQPILEQVGVERNAVLAGGEVSFTGGYVQYAVKVWDEYLDEYSEIVSTEYTAPSESPRKTVIPGAYTDMQRLLLSEDTEACLGTAHFMTNKPDGEAVPAGGKVTVPVFSTEYKAVDVYLDAVENGTFLGSHSLYATESSWMSFAPTEVGLHSLVWDGMDLPPFFIHVIPSQPFARYFEFVNRLGAVESVYTFGRAKRERNVSQERQVKNWNRSFRPSARYVKRTLHEEDVLKLSTGPVTREWARWFAEEFFVAGQTWMYSSAANDMIPVIIESEEAIGIYNESEAEVLDLPFTVTMCING